MRRNFPLTFILGSNSKIKVSALEQAIHRSNLYAGVIPIKASSNVAEQPSSPNEILQGAINRALDARLLDPRGAAYIAIENGIWHMPNGVWVDYAICLIYVPSTHLISWSNSQVLEFPTEAVDATFNKEGGFELNTVGQTLKEMGLVTRADDPHFDLCGESRTDIIADALVELFTQTSVSNTLENL